LELAWHTMVTPGCEISMSMKIITTDESNWDPNTKCPNPRCAGRSAEISNKQAFSCQICHLTYSLMPGELEPESTSNGSQDTNKTLDMTPYRRLLLAPAPSPGILGVDNQIASFKRVHLIMPRVRETLIANTHSMVKTSPGPPLVGQVSKWMCCNCGLGWFAVSVNFFCPGCQCARCKYCTHG
jgi:hypothetical protein